MFVYEIIVNLKTFHNRISRRNTAMKTSQIVNYIIKQEIVLLFL